MTVWLDLLNFGGAVAGLTIALMSLFLVALSRYLENPGRRFFISFFTIVAVYSLSDLVSQLSFTFGDASFSILSGISLFAESLLSSMLLPLLSAFFLFCAGEDWKKSPLFHLTCILWMVYAVMLIIAQFTTAFYVITPENGYYRGAAYPLILLSPALLILCNLAGLLRRRKKLTLQQRRGFLLFFLIPLICMLIQMFFYGVLVIVMGIALGSFILFLFILNEQMDQYVRQRTENQSQRLNISVLQMRPHFIYNTMTSIYYLVQQDSGKAQRVIEDFTNYLRKNFTAIAANEPILFTEELEHTRAYLAVEQVRFEGKLFVRYDTPMTKFRMPPLTLQPIVENAVKHGVDPDLDPVTITIHTGETAGDITVTVEDNGVGFHDSEGASPREALENIRQRLKLMCDGTLSITPREFGGTVVTIRIPKEPE